VKPELAELVQRALSRDTAQRLKGATPMGDALRQLVTGEPRLYLHEITSPDDRERSSRAPRLSLPDTVMIGPTPVSGAPVVTTTAPARSRRASLPLMLGAAALAGVTAWTLSERPVRSSDDHGAVRASAPVVVSSLPPPALAVASVVPPSLKRFSLEVRPVTARVALDGAVVEARAGRVLLEGVVGSVHTARVTVGGRSHEQRVAITEDGLIPARVALPAPSGAPAQPSPAALKTAPASETQAGPAAEAESSNGLITKFE
jgi:hypothetical protein